MQYIRRNWFDIGTMLWAIALVATAAMWVATPAFAFDEGPDCGLACNVACEPNDGCDFYIPSGGGCEVYCQDGTKYRCIAA